jgi:hypothetical protein
MFLFLFILVPIHHLMTYQLLVIIINLMLYFEKLIIENALTILYFVVVVCLSVNLA